MKQINYYLFKLVFLKGTAINKKNFNKKNIPDNIYYNRFTGKYTLINCDSFNQEDLDTFIKVKNAYNLNVIRVCVIILTILIGMLVFQYLNK